VTPICSTSRFAPAPTGRLHLGHVVNAIYVWGLAHARGARVLLRIEDHDAQRARREYESAILDDLDWLGFAPDLFPTGAFRRGPCVSRQSDRHAAYADAAARLASKGLVYGCRCTRRDVARAVEGAVAVHGCPGGCRTEGISARDGLAWRVRLPSVTVRFDDLECGPQQQPPDGEDPVIRDRLNNWTYTFAVCVDDFAQDIDLVIRGRDLLAATGRQITLGGLLGRPQPAVFAHHPLVMKSPTQKLSKSDGDTAIAALRERGWDAARVLGEAASRVGLVVAGGRLEAAQVPALFRDAQPRGRG
jgi:glutamyl-tRNA synthetase/glutamyl-Q tRNA(Asp) synthetase